MTFVQLGVLSARLVVNGVRFRMNRLAGAAAPPQALSLEVTRRCLARCIMCNIWRDRRAEPELSAQEWLRVLDSPFLRDLRELDLTGGEPFLRGDLAEILKGICRLKRERFPRLQSIAITSNGFLTGKVLRETATLLPDLEREGIGLVFALGLDAAGDLHDRIRGYPGGWEKLDATIRGLAELRRSSPALVLGIKTTVTRHNIGELDGIVSYADRYRLFTIISPFIVTPARYANLDRLEDLSLAPEDRQALIRFYAQPRFRWSYYRRELLEFLRKGEMRKPCTAGHNYYFLRSDGELFPCPLIDLKLGNLRTAPLGELCRSFQARRFRRSSGRFSDCRTCTEPGLERYALPCEGFHYLRQLFKLGPEGFLELHQHLGFEKYFP